MQSIRNLTDKLLFAGLLLMGIQIPNFMVQYQQFIRAHYQESRAQLDQYQQIADHYYTGNLSELLLAHRHNPVKAIRAEADIIDQLIRRSEYLRTEVSALSDQPLSRQLLHLTENIDYAIGQEVLQNYSVTLPLNTEAISIGLIAAFATSLLLRLFIVILRTLLRPKRCNDLFYRA